MNACRSKRWKYLMLSLLLCSLIVPVRGEEKEQEKFFDELIQENSSSEQALDETVADESDYKSGDAQEKGLARVLELGEIDKLDPIKIPQLSYAYDFNLVWKAAMQALKQYQLDSTNKILGQIKTRWVDNTQYMMFIDPDLKIHSARFRILLLVNNIKDQKNVRTQVTIYAQQHVIPQALTKGDYSEVWVPVESDLLLEKTIFYRIDQLLKMNDKIAEQKKKEPAQLK